MPERARGFQQAETRSTRLLDETTRVRQDTQFSQTGGSIEPRVLYLAPSLIEITGKPSQAFHG